MKFILKRATKLTTIVTLLFILWGCSNSPTKDIPVTGISLDQTMVSLNIGESVKLKATILPQNATNQNLIWTSSNEEIFSVSDDGLVTALDYGTAVISVSTGENEITSSCGFRVQGDWVKGELFARIRTESANSYEVAQNLQDQFSEFELKVISITNYPDRIAHLSYNSDIINEFEMLEKIRNAQSYNMPNYWQSWRVIWAAFERDWIHGEINISTSYYRYEFDEKSLNDFILSFSKYELNLLFIDRTIRITTTYRFSFNPDLINEFDLYEEFRNDSRIRNVNFMPALPDWTQGEVRVDFKRHFNYDDDTENFLLRYAEYELKVLDFFWRPHPDYVVTFVLLWFNHHLICEYEFVEMLRKDPDVMFAGIRLPNF